MVIRSGYKKLNYESLTMKWIMSMVASMMERVKFESQTKRCSQPMVVGWQACWNRNTFTENCKYKYKKERVKPRYVFCPWQPAGKLVALQGGGGCRAEPTENYFIRSCDMKLAFYDFMKFIFIYCLYSTLPSSIVSPKTPYCNTLLNHW